MSSPSVFATPQAVASIDECFFYHTMEVPGHGVRPGQWDLRNTIDDYLGWMNFKGKRVLDIGAADGFICFHVERQGAEVVGYDLSDRDMWDLVPFAQYDYTQTIAVSKGHIKQLNNAFWFSRRAFESNAQLVHGTVYTIPREIGVVDAAIFGSILLHVRDPFAALQAALALTKETVIVVEPLRNDWISRVLRKIGLPYMQFLPDANRVEPKDSWWYLSPAVMVRIVGVLGFQVTRLHYHIQQYGEWGKFARVPYYTLIAKRTHGKPVV